MPRRSPVADHRQELGTTVQPFTECLLSPSFVVGWRKLSEDGEKFGLLQFDHPRLGIVTLVWPIGEIRKMHEALEVLITS